MGGTGSLLARARRSCQPIDQSRNGRRIQAHTTLANFHILTPLPLNTFFKQTKFDLFSISEEMVGEVVITPRQKLADLIRLAELCVDLLRQNEEFYAEVRL